ncbi:MAG: BlaI family transcriptional regulator [Planctomycetaceae bacterium]|nr:BlaI family transcriptional regulator [Planctomycetaceae bacterium]
MGATQLGRVQLRIMQVLWERRTATAREITDALNESEPTAHSTVQTLLRGLEDKQAIDHKPDGRTFVFFPLVKEDEFRNSATRDLVERVFGGKAKQLVAHLLASESITREELDEIRKLINRRSRKREDQR